MNDPAPARAERAFRIGFWGNAGLAVLKLVVGWLTGSRALVADGFHSLADILTNGGVWLAHRWAKRPADEDHHYGHGNGDALAGLLVGILLVAAGAGVVVSAFRSDAVLREGFAAWVALGVAAFSVAANVVLAVITLRAAREGGGQGLRALARDNGSDALAGVLVMLGIAGAQSGVTWSEPAAAVAVGLLIVILGLRSARDGFDVLMDRVTDPTLRERLWALAAGVDHVRGVQRVRVHPMGTSHWVDLEISVDGTQTVEEGHRIAHAVETALVRSSLRVTGVQVHVNPWPPPATPEER